MNIQLDEGTHKLGDKVWVPIEDENKKSKGIPVIIEAMRVTMRKNNEYKIEYFSKEGKLGDLVYSDPWLCGEVINIMENHKKMVFQEIETLKEKFRKRKEQEK